MYAISALYSPQMPYGYDYETLDLGLSSAVQAYAKN
jgi:hypothetical protein